MREGRSPCLRRHRVEHLLRGDARGVECFNTFGLTHRPYSCELVAIGPLVRAAHAVDLSAQRPGRLSAARVPRCLRNDQDHHEEPEQHQPGEGVHREEDEDEEQVLERRAAAGPTGEGGASGQQEERERAHAP